MLCFGGKFSRRQGTGSKKKKKGGANLSRKVRIEVRQKKAERDRVSARVSEEREVNTFV